MAELSPSAFGFNQAAEAPQELDPSAFGFGTGKDVAKPSGIARRALGDTGVSLAKGIIGVPEAAVGLANLPTGGLAGKAAQAIGFAPKEWKDALDEYYSPEQKAANAAVQQAQGFGGTLKAAIQNPSVIAGTVAESLPLMIGGGAVARALPAGLSAVARGAIGEGIVGAGSASEQMRQASEDGLQSQRQAIASLASGAGTAAFGALGGKLSQRMGIADVDTLLAGGSTRVARDAAGNVINKGLPRRVIEGGLAEGALEELPQSMWEQAAQNVGTGQPIAAGVPEAGAMGMLAGTAMGSVSGGIYKPTIDPSAGPMQAAAAVGIASGAVQQAQQAQAAVTLQTQSENEEATNGKTNPDDARTQGASLAQNSGPGEAPIQAASSPLATGLAGYANPTEVTTAPQGPAAASPFEQQQAIAAPESTVTPSAPIVDTTQAVPAGAPQPPTIGGISNGNQTEITQPAAAGRQAQPAPVSGASVVPPLQYPQQQTSNAGPLPQQDTAMPVPASTFQVPSKQPASSLQAPSPTDKDSLTVQSPATAPVVANETANDAPQEPLSLPDAPQPVQENKTGQTPATASDAASLSSDADNKLHQDDRQALIEKRKAELIENRKRMDTAGPLSIASFTNHDTKMTAFVHHGQDGKFNVTLRDDESGEYVPIARTGFQTVDGASAFAKQAAGITSIADRKTESMAIRNEPAVRAIAASAPKVASLADRLKAAAANAVGSRKALLEARMAKLEAAKPATTEAKPIAKRQSQAAPIMRRDDLVGAIMRVTGGNGIAANMALTIAGDTAPKLTRLRGLFTNRGTSDLGEVAMLLREEEGFDVRDGERLSELIRDASFGNVAVSMERHGRDMDADNERRHRDRIRAQAKKYGVKVVGVKFSVVEGRVLFIEQRRQRKAVELLSDRDKARFDAAVAQSEGLVSDEEIQAILNDVADRGITGRDAWQEALVLQRQLAEDARFKQEQGYIENAEDRATDEEPDWFKDFDDEADSKLGNEGATAASDDFGLEQQTISDIDRQEADRVAAEKAKQADAAQEAADRAASEKQSLADKIKARAEDPDNFQFGEDSKAAAKPMGGLFDQPARPTKTEKPAQEYAEGDKVRFTPHDVGELRPVVEGILVQKASTTGGNFRLRIRTETPNEHGGGNVTPQVYSQNGTIEKIGDGLNAPRDRLNMTPDQAAQHRVDMLAADFTSTIYEESKTDDFDPAEVPAGAMGWAKDAGVDERAFLNSVISAVEKETFRRKAGVLAALRAGMQAQSANPEPVAEASKPTSEASKPDGEGGKPAADAYPAKAKTPEAKADEASTAAINDFGEKPGETRHNVSTDTQSTPSDRAVYGMVADGKSSAEVLSFISKASRRPFNRVLASHLARIGVTPNITLDSQGGWQFGNTSRAQRYAAAYNPKTDTVALFTPRDAERHALHEFTHAATLKAIAAGGAASVQMRALFLYVKRNGSLDGQYGMTNLDEFVAEAFSNPKFQQALKAIPAPAGSGLKSAWHWFVRAVARILGLRTAAQETALDRAMTVGGELMRENAALLERNGEKLDAIREADAVRFNAADDLPPTITVDGIERPTTNSNGKPIAQDEAGVRRFYEWFGDSKVVDEKGRPLVVYHGSPDLRFIKDEAVFKSQKGRAGFGRSDASHWFSADPKTARSYADPHRAFDYQNSEEGVIEAYIRIENPLVVNAGGQEWRTAQKRGKTSDVIEEARTAGNDGVIINSVKDDYNNVKSTKPTRTFTVFDSSQIKSATGNSGQFDPTNPDIRYNIATDWISNPTVSDFVANATRSDKSTSIITPFNTQYHKAHKWAAEGKPWFKRVFDLGQKFLSDTSRFAVMAQDAAPAMFHEVKSLADAKTALRNIRSFGDLSGATHRRDIDAAANPLYEGTLYGGGNPMSGIVFSDSMLRHKYKLTDRQIRLYREALASVNVSLDEMAKSIIARHAKQNNIDFNPDMDIDDMADAVIEAIEDRKDDLEYSVGAEMEEEAKATAENLRDMDQPEEAKKTLDAFKKRKDAATSTVARLDKTIADIKGVVGKNKRLQEHGYFPLMRFGKHTVTAKDAEGKTAYFGMFDGIPLVPQSGQYQANKVAAAIRAEHPEWEVTTGIHNTEKYKLYEGMNLEAVQLFAEHMDKDSLEPFQEFLRLATGDRSVMKRLVHRQGTPGFDRDVRRTLAQFIVSNARHASSSYNLFDMRKAAESANEDGGDIGAEAVKLYKYVAEPAEEAHQLRAFLFFNFLGGSIASAMVNLSQVPMMTFPYLTQYESAGKLANRLRVAARTAVGDPAKIPGTIGAALVRAEQDGVTAPQEIHQLTATAANSIFSGNPAMTGLLRFWGMPFSMAESFNRRTTFIAAYQIAEAMTPAQLAATGTNSAFEFAERAVTDTQGIYNKGNRMNIGRGAVGATLMTFKQFSIMYLELMRRLPRNQQLLMIGIMTLAAGAGGWPFAEDVEDIIDTFGQWLGFGTNSKRWIRNTIAGATSPQIADILLNGAASQMGIDLHSRLGTHNLIPGSGALKQSSTDKGRDAAEFFGPAASVLQNAATALQEMATGHAGRAVKAMAPVAAQNAIKGYDMASTGYAEDSKGRRTIPVSGPESVAKGVGFNPKTVADFGAIKRDIAQDTRMLSVKREEFTSAIADAILSGDRDAGKAALAEMAQWNMDNPKMRVVIAPGAVVKRVKEARTEGADRFLKAVPKAIRADSRQEFAQS